MLFETEFGPSAVIITLVKTLTLAEEMVNVPVVAPAATVRFAGNVTVFKLLDRLTLMPPVGAGSSRDTVPTVVLPPAILAGFSTRLVIDGGSMVSETPIEDDESDAIIFAVVAFATEEVVTLNAANVAPAATKTLDGAFADGELLERLIFVPAAGAGPVSETVPTQLEPPATVVLLNVNRLSPGASTVSEAEIDFEARVAFIVALDFDATGFVLIAKVAVVAPLRTVTEVGTATEVPMALRVTTLPPEGALVESVTVPVAEEPPTTDVGVSASLLSVWAFAEFANPKASKTPTPKQTIPFTGVCNLIRIIELCNWMTALTFSAV